MPSRRAEDLHAILQPQAKTHLAACELEWPGRDIEVFFTCTYRSGAEQNQLWSLGRTVRSHVGPWTAARPLGRVVTRAKAGQSAHNYEVSGKPAALAYDLAVIVFGKLVWDSRSPYWQRVGQLGTGLGLVWYGSPNAPFQEAAHFQHPLAQDLMRGTP